MNDDETITVGVMALAKVLASVDGWCRNCQTDISEEMQALDPSHDWLALIMRVSRIGGDRDGG